MKKIKNISKQFPSIRMRRNRMKSFSRRLIAENKISIDDLIWPLFVIEGTNVKAEVLSMPGVARLSVDNLLKEVETACKLKIPAVAIFPHIDGNFKDDSDYNYNINLKKGCFQFLLTDKMEDGISVHWWYRNSDPELVGVNGSVTILSMDGEEIYNFKPDFGEELRLNFIVN